MEIFDVKKNREKILIANRSEIAVRVINTCRTMGIATVAVYAEDDLHSLHRKLADEAYSLGEGELSETYLNEEKIVDIARKAGAQAIHPGYGFLSERPSFPELCEKSGITFIGPSSQVIALMGNKAESKRVLEKMNIPLIPGHHGKSDDDGELEQKAKALGTPLLIKAIAGGGGKGMRLVEDLSRFREELAAARREAQNAFGDGRVLLEKFITNPRHIEVQVLSDSHGQHFHLWERECSIQRRHQKIIEETPAPALDQTLREEICQTAVHLCQQINYLGAGTVEFILDGDAQGEEKFYFLEMNTRLQVEHPITEMVTGYDLVEGQIRVARGEKLSLRQEDIIQRGHALEVRLYAEDPERNFLPTGEHCRNWGVQTPRRSFGMWPAGGKCHRQQLRSHDRQTLRPGPRPKECHCQNALPFGGLSLFGRHPQRQFLAANFRSPRVSAGANFYPLCANPPGAIECPHLGGRGTGGSGWGPRPLFRRGSGIALLARGRPLSLSRAGNL